MAFSSQEGRTMAAKALAPDPYETVLFEAELEAVLASRLFARAPSLSKILRFLCAKRLHGDLDSVSEWTIAVDVLGRRPDFDPERNSIVRVELHHLRKRLASFYSGEGAAHPVRITFPEGGYIPHFTFAEQAGAIGNDCAVEQEQCCELAPQVVATAAPQDETRTKADLSPGLRRAIRTVRVKLLRPRVLLSVLAAALLSAAALAIARSGTSGPGVVDAKRTLVSQGNGELPGMASDSIRIRAGLSSPTYIDSSGRSWSGDKYFSGGTPFSHPEARVYRTTDQAIYTAGREGDFRYDIPVRHGGYDLRLHFAETRYGQSPLQGAEAQRRFTVTLNGNTLLQDFDITNDAAGADTATVKIWSNVSPSPDGFVHLAFSDRSGPSMLNALELVPGKAGEIPPVRIVCSTRPVYDRQGRLWIADTYYLGGRLVERIKPISGFEDPALLSSVRFGNFTYAIPVVAGRTYRAKLWFADSTFTRPGSRLFDIFCNGRVLASDFDILREAGGQSRSVARTFEHLRPNAQGKLNLAFVPTRDYAGISALEVSAEEGERR